MKTKFLAIWIVVLAAIVSSCMEANGPVMNEGIPIPSKVELSIKKNTMTAKWEYDSNTKPKSFVAQLSPDKNFNAIAYTDTLKPDAREIVYDSVGYSNDFYFRILAVADNVAKNSPFAAKALHLENVFQEPSENNGTSIQLNWGIPNEGSVTNIVLIGPDGSQRNIELTSQQISNRSIVVQNLKDASDYTAVLYDGDIRKGVIQFNTIDTSAYIRINHGMKIYQSLQQAVDDASSGDTLQIQGKHDLTEDGRISIEKDLAIVASDTAETLPELTVAGFDVSNVVKELTVSGLRIEGTGDFTFKLSGGSNVIVKDSNISSFTVGLYKAGSGNYGFTMDNSLVHDFAIPEDVELGVFELTGGQPVSFNITNSTFWNVASSFIHASGDVLYQDYQTNYPIIDHCTFNDIAAGMFTYIRSQNTFKLRMWHSILTNKKSDVKNGMLVETFANHNNTYGDYHDRFFEYWWGWKNQGYDYSINEMNLDPMYADPANGDFTVGNQTLIDSTFGDPRWLPNN